LLFASQASAQKSQVRSRVIGPVDETRTVKTSGNVHPLARTEYDQGALGDSQPMTRMLILLQRGDDQEASLRQLLEDQQTTGSANYHKWLTPAQFGTEFGPSDAEVQAVTDWLTRQGFQVTKVSAGRTTVEFSGTAGQVRSAFQTEIHQFSANGKNFIANVSEPSIPAALAPVVRGVVALHNYPKEAHVRNVGQYRRIKATGELKPLFTYGSPANYALAPADFATIYNAVPIAGADGTGQTIAVVGQSNIIVQDIIDFRNLFGLPQNFTQANNIIVNGPDPGIVAGDEGESDLDIEWAGALAPNANILFVTSEATSSNPSQVTAGVDLSALYIIDNNLAPVMSESYGGCEFNNGTLGNAFYNQIWQQAAAQGITVAVSAGDNGSAACDNPNTATAASGGLAVNGVASTPYNVAIGGTDFNPSTTTTQYWGATNTTTTQGSALSYIPEVTWNDSTCATNYPTACTTVDSTGGDLTAASGGPSNCAVLTSNGSGCSAGYTKPAFQTGSGFGSFLSASTNPVLPDVSFFASNGWNGVAVIVCQADSSPQNGASCSLSSPFTDFSLVGGTSVSTPAFAAVMAMVNQKTGQRQGNANYVLYGLAAKDTNYVGGKCNGSIPGTPPASTCVFNDVVEAANTNSVEWNNTVACAGGSLNCSNTATGGFGVLVSGSTAAFVANVGYDAATGLGSINVTNLLKAWGTFSRTPTTTTLTTQSTSPSVSGQNFTFTVTVTPAPPTTSSETVSLIANTANGQVAIGAGTNGLPFVLASNGTVTATTNLLPPGTTSIVASYGGDATHTASTSTPPLPFVANGSNQASKTNLRFVTFDSNNNPVLSSPSQSVTAAYGSAYILQISVTPTNGNACAPSGGTSTFPTPTFPCATGKITLTDNNSPLNDFPKGPTSNATNTATLNNVGIAEDQPIQLPAGPHSIVASYAGDPNYQASSSPAMSVTITPGSTTTNVTTSMSAITTGATVQLTASIGTTSSGEAPCGITNGGTVAFTSNGTALTGTVSYTAIPFNTTSGAAAACTATLTTAISSLYPPPTNQPKIPTIPLVLFALGLILFLALVRWMPESRRRAYGYAALVAFALLAGVIAGCGGGGSSNGGGGGGGGSTRTIKATYSGDTNYSTSNGSTTIQIQ
jgi:hypothetical protein